MSALPSFAIAFADDDHVLRLMRDLILFDTPDTRARAAAFFLPEIVEESVLESAFYQLRTHCTPTVAPVGSGISGLTALIVRRGTVTADLVADAARLTLVQRLGDRRKGLDIMACRSRGIEVSLLPRHSLEHVADHTMMLILAALRRFTDQQSALHSYGGPAGDFGQVAYNWPAVAGIRALSGLTLGIVGLGEIGRRVARRAEAFGMRIVWTARGQVDSDVPVDWIRLDLPDLLSAADIVSLHAPPKDLTGPLVGAAELARMKSGAVLVNTARGALVDEDALAEALRAGRLAGAALDVHAQEPPDRASSLWNAPGVLMTPHVAGGSRREVLREMAAISDNLVDTVHGLPPRHGRVVA